MSRFSKLEGIARKRRELIYIDPYPDVEEFHQNDLLRYFDQMNLDYLVARKTKTKTIDSAVKVKGYIEEVKHAFKQSLGELPHSTANRVEITKTLDQGTYLIDNVFIESLPDLYISANFYYPKDCVEPRPAVLLLCGHAPEGKANVTYISFCVEAVSNGFCVLVIDPLGQGERKVENLKENAADTYFSPVRAHCFIDQQLSLMGEQAVQYMMWDNIKGLDYLLSRKEVDPERVAVSGNSGGGTMAAFMGVFDDRIKAVAPSCYITELYALIRRILAQDCEQCLPNFMKYGLNLSDLVTAAAPKPYFIGTALVDFFPIDGARDAYVEAKHMYRLLDKVDNLDIYTAAQGHGFWFDIRAKTLQFLCSHFNVEFIENKAIDYEQIPTEEQLLCAPNGKPSPYTETTIEDMVLSKAAAKFSATKKEPLPQDVVRERVMNVLEIDLDLLNTSLIETKPLDDQSKDVSAAGVTFFSERHMKISGVLYEKKGESKDSLLLFVGDREQMDVEQLLRGHSAVFCVEPRGIGQGTVNKRSSFGIFDVEMATCYNAQMQGRTMQGMMVMDVIAAVEILKAMDGYGAANIVLYGKEEHALTALYTAIITRTHHVWLENLLDSFKSIVNNKVHQWGPAIFAIGLLNNYDVSDLVSAVSPDKIRIDSRSNHLKSKVL
jgi:cephalosporin-C deacetylase-like acetyl esterase